MRHSTCYFQLLFNAMLMVCLLWACEEEVVFDQEEQFEKDLEIVANYLSENQITAIEHPSGMSYEIFQQGLGNLALPGDQLRFEMVITRMDGQPWVHHSGLEIPALNWTISSSVIQGNGLQTERPLAVFEILDVLRRGGHALLYVPSKLGYGFEGQRFQYGSFDVIETLDIEPNVNLVIELTLN